MGYKKRYLDSFIKKDLQEKMIFIGGPRQVGKTTLALSFTKNKQQYLSFDDLEDRELIKKHQIDPSLKLVVLDEIHKYIRWRTLVKGLYDKYKDALKIIVTGSAKLNHFRKGGDSLFGRYRYYRLHPLTLGEVDPKYQMDTVKKLLAFGGFPEPFFKGDEVTHRRFLRERKERVVFQDIQDLGTIRELTSIELLVDILEGRVGSQLSLNSLARDLEVSPNTIKNWLNILDQVYYSYRILPYGSSKIKAIKKTQKLYLWDYSEVLDMGARFENMVASTLLKYCHLLEDTEGFTMELRYIRDINLREVDFVVLKDKKPIFAVECKTSEKTISPAIQYFKERTPIPLFYQVHLGEKEYLSEKVHVLPFNRFAEILKI